MSIIRTVGRCLPMSWRGWLRTHLPATVLARLGGGARPREETVRAFEDMFVVVELENAEPVVGALFRRRFRTTSFPDQPRHFVGFYLRDDGSRVPLGYVHHSLWQGNSLCGGLVIDERRYREVPACDRAVIHGAGGVAEAMLRGSFARLPQDLIGIWAHVGHKQSEQVCLRVGYRHTTSQYVMVIWQRPDLSEQDKAAWVARVTDHGPF